MQFEIKEQLGNSIKRVSFSLIYKLNPKALLTLVDLFIRIGGNKLESFTEWEFPSFVSSQIIKEIIDNHCFICGGLMKDSTAFKNEDLIHKERIIWKDSGKARQLNVRKCTECGHSHT